MVKRAVIFGLLGGVGLISFYLLVMSLASGSWSYTLENLWQLRLWVGALVLGFSVQVGLYSYLKSCSVGSGVTTGAAATGVTTSSVAMLACCAHHITDILPILGLSAATLFLTKYQNLFFALGIASNLMGIFIMLKRLKRIKNG